MNRAFISLAYTLLGGGKSLLNIGRDDLNR